MEVNKVFETPDGSVTFQGTLTGRELEAILTVGLNYLLQVGAIVQLKEEDLEKTD